MPGSTTLIRISKEAHEKLRSLRVFKEWCWTKEQKVTDRELLDLILSTIPAGSLLTKDDRFLLTKAAAPVNKPARSRKAVNKARPKNKAL